MPFPRLTPRGAGSSSPRATRDATGLGGGSSRRARAAPVSGVRSCSHRSEESVLRPFPLLRGSHGLSEGQWLWGALTQDPVLRGAELHPTWRAGWACAARDFQRSVWAERGLSPSLVGSMRRGTQFQAVCETLHTAHYSDLTETRKTLWMESWGLGDFV